MGQAQDGPESEEKADQERRNKLKILRERTGLPFLKCRDALESTGYDVDRAWWLLYHSNPPYPRLDG